MRTRRLKQVLLGLTLLGLLAGGGVLALQSLERAFDLRPLMESKARRELTATVKAKGYRKYDATNCAYDDQRRYICRDDEGRELQRYPGDEDWLIYYEIEQFDPRDEPVSSHLLDAEKQRVASGHRRVTIFTKEQYDRTKVGDQIHLAYQRFGDGPLMQIW